MYAVHKEALSACASNRHVTYCFVFLCTFPFAVTTAIPWAPPWASICLWYAFLVQEFCTHGTQLREWHRLRELQAVDTALTPVYVYALVAN